MRPEGVIAMWPRRASSRDPVGTTPEHGPSIRARDGVNFRSLDLLIIGKALICGLGSESYISVTRSGTRFPRSERGRGDEHVQ